ncbi:hypothetical protein M758_4G198300 [Ceratodon purpureus]|nr:hypothetical protein M758_4G198300 [Ceratodon purpureus]
MRTRFRTIASILYTLLNASKLVCAYPRIRVRTFIASRSTPNAPNRHHSPQRLRITHNHHPLPYQKPDLPQSQLRLPVGATHRQSHLARIPTSPCPILLNQTRRTQFQIGTRSPNPRSHESEPPSTAPPNQSLLITI